MQDPGSRVCLGLLCGVPASGKSTLALQMLEHTNQHLPGQLTVLLLQYDRLIPSDLEQQLITQSAEQGGSLWKSTRTQVVVCVDFLLSQLVQLSGSELVKLFTNHQDQSSSLSSSWEHLSAAADQSEFTQQGLKPPTVDAALWKRFICCIRESLKRRAVRTFDHDEALGPWLVLVDDNMHYSSMRYEYCQLARKYEVGLCIIYVSCPLEEALQRNRSRSEGRVEDHVIAAMHERLETPDSDKRPWEKYSSTVDGIVTVDLPLLLDMIHQAMKDPQRPSPEEDVEVKAVSRYVCSTNTIHQADQILRKCVSLHMTQSKAAGLGPRELKNLSARLTTIRTDILGEMRTGEITLPFLPDETSVMNSSKDANSPLYQCVQRLFHARSLAESVS